MAMKWVDIYHPGLNTSSRVSERAFEKVWSEKGWVLASGSDTPTQEAPEPEPEIEDEPLSEEYHSYDEDDIIDEDE